MSKHCMARRLGVAALLFSSALVSPAFAADAAGDADAASTIDEIIVTARAGSEARTRLDTSYAVTTVNEETLRMRAPMSVADALKSVPGFWVEASGGEASANIRARGIPQEGFAAVALYEDGLPIQHDAGLGWMNADQSFRLDETIQRFEVVRGGPSSIFASYAPGGTVNFISRKGGDVMEGVVKATVGDYGMARVEGWVGGPIGEWRFGVGGFYRESDGIRDPGYTADKGGQIRVSLGREFERGSIHFNIKHLDDNAIFYTGVPIKFDANGKPSETPGFDALTGTWIGPDTANVRPMGRNGQPFDLDVKDGTDAKLTAYTGELNYEIAEGWNFRNAMRYRTSDIARQGLFPNTPLLGSARLSAVRSSILAAVPGATDVQLRYTSAPTEIFNVANQNGNGLVSDGSIRQVAVTLDEFVNDARLSHKFDFGSQSHDVSIGFYFAKGEESFDRYSANALLDVREQARRLDIVAVNAAGTVLYKATDNGFTRYGAEFADGEGESTTYAFYLSDEWQVNDKLRIDGGMRWEKVNFVADSQRTATVNLGLSPSQADDTFLTGSGVFDHVDRSFDHMGWTLGADYRVGERQGVFARWTSTFRLPSLGDYITNAANTSPYVQTMDLAELGYKLSVPTLDLYATGFYTAYDSLSFGGLQFVNGSYVNQTVITDTETFGLEVEGTWRPHPMFDLGFSGTYQDPKFGDYTYFETVNNLPTERDFSGNRLVRVPKFSGRLTPAVNLMDDRLRAELDFQYFGDRFSDAANTQVLPKYHLLNATVRFNVTDKLSIYGYGTNLTNELGLTEGNPRAGAIVSSESGSLYGIGRPELGRAFRAAVMYRF
ncbi:TonB-dependent receptor [Caulobacter sp. NIBR2454]|uniref:TonB-dependent receptor n=1 Tax=Caulobacter sp. NIBR2454 TaxID=3015996 RepID=UPI0022B65124|nr:TonB-dependent receptor [Caulobacter sp. NIBR2454]